MTYHHHLHHPISLLFFTTLFSGHNLRRLVCRSYYLIKTKERQRQPQQIRMMFRRLSLILTATTFAFNLAQVAAADEPIPTCDAISVAVLNDCAAACQDIGETINVDESRDVNGDYKCYCTNTAICNDEPLCQDLLIVPGLVEERCTSVCGDGITIQVEDGVRYTDDPQAGNKNQTHFMVSCFCDGVKQCGTDFVLFSDLTFLPACTSDGVPAGTQSLNIASESECTTYCVGFGFAGASYDATKPSCTCTNSDGEAMACDNSIANTDRGDFIGCFEQVGVSEADCPPTEAPTMSSAPKMSVMMVFVALVVLVGGQL